MRERYRGPGSRELGRTNHEQEPLSQSHTASMSKLQAVGRPEELKAVVGWLLDIRDLLLSLSGDKFKECYSYVQLMTLVSSQKCTGCKLRTLSCGIHYPGGPPALPGKDPKLALSSQRL
jgi:hypothetical protein